MVGPAMAASLESLSHSRSVASLSLFYGYYHGKCSFELAEMVPCPHPHGRVTRYFGALHDFAVVVPDCKKKIYASSFFPRTANIWNSLPADCFSLRYDLSHFKSNVNRYLLSFFLSL